jgi:hypothetical protein
LNPFARLSRHYLDSGGELIARMSSAVGPGWRDRTTCRLFLFNSGSGLVAGMSVVVCLGKRDGIASRFFLLNSDSELVAKINHVVCPGWRAGIVTGLFHLDRGNEFVARMSLAACPVKRGGRASSLFRINRNLGRLRSFRAALAMTPLHSDTILAQSVQAELSAVTDNAPTGKGHLAFVAAADRGGRLCFL